MTDSAMDRIEATITELTSTQLKLTAVVDAMVTKLANLLQRLALRDATQHFPSSSPMKSPPTDAPISIPLPMSTSIPCLAPMQPSLTPKLAPLPIVASYLLANSKSHASSFNPYWAAIHRIRSEFPSRRILPSDFRLSLSVMFTAKVRNKELDHPFLLTLYATLDAAKWLCLCHTNLHSLIPTPTLIWDLGTVFGSHGLKPQHLEDKLVLMDHKML